MPLLEVVAAILLIFGSALVLLTVWSADRRFERANSEANDRNEYVGPPLRRAA